MWKVNDCHGTVFQCSCFSRNPSSWSPPGLSLARSLALSLSLLSLFIHRLVLHSSAQAERNKTVYAAAKADKFAQGINIYKPRLSPYRNTTWRTWACTYGTIQHDPDSTAAISASALTIEKVLGSLGEGWHFHFFLSFLLPSIIQTLLEIFSGWWPRAGLPVFSAFAQCEGKGPWDLRLLSFPWFNKALWKSLKRGEGLKYFISKAIFDLNSHLYVFWWMEVTLVLEVWHSGDRDGTGCVERRITQDCIPSSLSLPWVYLHVRPDRFMTMDYFLLLCSLLLPVVSAVEGKKF